MEKETKESGISLFDILHALWKNVILMGIIVVAVTVLGIVYTYGYVTPTYKSSTHVLVAVSPNSSSSKEGSVDYSNSLKVVQTIAELVEEDCVLDGVAEKHSDLTVSKIKSMVGVSVSSSSYIVTISVVSTDKALTKVIADEVAAELIAECDPDTGNEAIKVLQVTVNQTSPATNPTYNAPNKKLYVIVALLGGIVIACAVVFLKEFMSNKFKTKDEIESATGVRIVGEFVDNKENAKAKEIRLIDSTSVYQLEEYNTLLGNIKYANIENPYKVIAITSSTENELKTTTACNLAVAMAANGKKVIVVDLDIKRPTLHKAFNLKRTEGLVEYIDDSISYEKVIKHTEKKIDVITAGPAVLNSLVILESDHLKDLVAKLREDYDYIILDTTPLSVSNDSTVAAKLADGVLYNVSINQAKKKLIKEHLSQLNELGINVIGISVNKIPRSSKTGYYYYYNSYKDSQIDNSPAVKAANTATEEAKDDSEKLEENE
ncbi:MAG: polysaccharide biosynthesis tyrosine autokinase [Acholeplasmatales bacterium]|nr:polysaccharide biosynthesis tyrosine autokinase [Acholeplasmatales bacterium]